ncbi:MAG: PD-(D/E)XK nuclease family protein [Ignavibacteriales bacterium]|nr:PD-(D/E)XK nuclease family protein [Ignavibacteriales bacterium]
MQLALFDDIQVKTKTKIKWSYSKSDVLNQCARKFYYKYYGSLKTKALNEPYKERLIALNRLSNKYMIQGKIIHDVIKNYFKYYKQKKPWDVNKLIWWANKVYNEAIEYSKKFKIGQDEDNYPPSVFKEINILGNSWSEIKEEGEEKITTSLTNFFNSEKFTFLKTGGELNNSLIEDSTKFTIEDTIKVDGKIDIAFEQNGLFHIADWKTGKEEYQETSLQLIIYAFWSINEQKKILDNINIFKAYLFINELDILKLTETEVLRGKLRIIQEANKLNVLETFATNSNVDAFSKRNEVAICNLCPYQEICEKTG